MAKNIAWELLIKIVPKEIIDKTNESELYLRLINGAVIELKGSDNPDSLRGVGLDGVVLDEWAMQDPSVWSEIIRPALTDRQGWAVFIGTPAGKNHFYDLYSSTPEQDRVFLRASDTKIIPQAELDLARSEMNQDEYNQEFECSFLFFSGQVYKEFNPDKHVIKNPPKIDDRWFRGAAIDYGQVNPTCVLWYATDYDGRVFIYDEYYQAGKTVKQHAESIGPKLNNLTNLPMIDPSAYAKTRSKGDTPYSVVDEFFDNNISVVPAQNDVLGGINRVREYFEKDMLFVYPNCENLIKELQNYRWKPKKRVDMATPDEPLKVNDHACDSLRYIILSRPGKPTWSSPKNPLMDRYKKLTKPSYQKRDWYED